MPDRIDAYLGIHTRALMLESRRAELLANNLANADTPGFKSRDIDFKSALATAAGAEELKYRVPLAPALDGNTVDSDMEMAEFSRNALDFQASLTFLQSKFRGLKAAIRGE